MKCKERYSIGDDVPYTVRQAVKLPGKKARCTELKNINIIYECKMGRPVCKQVTS